MLVLVAAVVLVVVCVLRTRPALVREALARISQQWARVASRGQGEHNRPVPDVNEDTPRCRCGMTLSDELRELKQLHTEGVLTDKEFADAKAAVMQQAAGSSSVLKKKVRSSTHAHFGVELRNPASLRRGMGAGGHP